jgi:hypothetical protein
MPLYDANNTLFNSLQAIINLNYKYSVRTAQ